HREISGPADRLGDLFPFGTGSALQIRRVRSGLSGISGQQSVDVGGDQVVRRAGKKNFGFRPRFDRRRGASPIQTRLGNGGAPDPLLPIRFPEKRFRHGEGRIGGLAQSAVPRDAGSIFESDRNAVVQAYGVSAAGRTQFSLGGSVKNFEAAASSRS